MKVFEKGYCLLDGGDGGRGGDGVVAGWWRVGVGAWFGFGGLGQGLWLELARRAATSMSTRGRKRTKPTKGDATMMVKTATTSASSTQRKVMTGKTPITPSHKAICPKKKNKGTRTKRFSKRFFFWQH